jgi:hypothetical protein
MKATHKQMNKKKENADRIMRDEQYEIRQSILFEVGVVRIVEIDRQLTTPLRNVSARVLELFIEEDIIEIEGRLVDPWKAALREN